MKKRNIIKSFLTFVFLLTIGFAFNKTTNTYSNYLANSSTDFNEIFNEIKTEKLLANQSAIINAFTDDTIIGNTSCQSYEKTFRCQIFAMLPESSLRYKVFLTSKNNASAIELGELHKNKEGTYILESTIDKNNAGDQILITNGKLKIGYADFSILNL